ncbi:enoyl-CoA hydratase/isomerase family protein [Indiicoccus explosivorum]|uniref:enoyl-CoA hydratase/isomerase family protein n=1 Tax=Indiicoccus explosivorum TaxID=1917864 RepID=UPI000B44476D|nr:enoyl-CoA hydratase/isomerase family protein [Indiicoccus explosivorum]
MAYRIEESEGILTFTIDRPGIRNAVNSEVMDGLEKFISEARERNIRCAAVTGAGTQAFCSGGDLSVFHELKTEREAFPMLDRMAGLLFKLKTLPVPVVAIVNGTAVGGGCEIATACDFRLVHEEAKCGFIQGTLAITTGWGGGSFLLETLPHSTALRMLSSAGVFTAGELMEKGWATEIYRSEEDISAFFRQFLRVHPDVHAAYKQLAKERWETAGLRERVAKEVRRCAKLWEAEAHHEAVGEFFRKSGKS